MKKLTIILSIILCILIALDSENFNEKENIVLSTEVEENTLDDSEVTVTVTENEDVVVTLPDTEVETEDVTSVPLDTEIIETEEEIIESSQQPQEILYYCEWGNFYLTEDDYKLLLTTTFCEAGNQPSKTQQMTALVILNRLVAGMGGNTIRDIVYAKNAFSVTHWKNFEDRGWTDKVEQSVQLALKENPHPRDMYYFRTKHYHKWAKKYKKSGDVYFSTKK